MKTNLAVVSSPDDERDSRLVRLRAMSGEELERELTETLGLTAQGLFHAAEIVMILEEKGRDLSGLRIGILPILRKIACGQLLPEVVVQFASRQDLIRKISNLPIPDQQKIVTGSGVRMIEYDPETKTITHRMRDPMTLSSDEVAIVFASDHMRSDDEQTIIIHRNRNRQRAPSPQVIGKMKVDHARRGVIIGRHFISLENLEDAVRVLRRGKPTT